MPLNQLPLRRPSISDVFGRVVVLALALALLLSSAACDRAFALAACTADDIVAQEPACPSGTGPCEIQRKFEIGNNCTLDFGSRAVTIGGSTATGRLDIGPGNVVVRAGSLTVASTGLIDGRGNGASRPNDQGGNITVKTTGTVNVQKATTSPRGIHVSGRSKGGNLVIEAGGNVTIGGRLDAGNLSSTGAGGGITVATDGNLTALAGSALIASGGTQSSSSGRIDLRARGRVDLSAPPIVTGGFEGGTIDIEAGAQATIHGADASANGDGGTGGSVTVFANGDLSVAKPIDVRGSTSPTDSGGGDGGVIFLAAEFGNLVIGDDILADGAAPDGAGAELDLSARGTVTIAANAKVSASGNGAEGEGGGIDINSERDIVCAGIVAATGGALGGEVSLNARGRFDLTGRVDVSSSGAGGIGGVLTMNAGNEAFGTMSIQGVVDAGGGPCGDLFGCGFGGTIELGACNLTVGVNATVSNRGPDGGRITLSAREQLTIAGSVDSTKKRASGTDGTNAFSHPRRKTPQIATGTVKPSPLVAAYETCTSKGQRDCLVPCPVCGNRVVEFPETCEHPSGVATNCNGCSIYCQIENCDDGLYCTADSCDTQLGCHNDPLPACVEPTPTPSPTITPTATETSGVMPCDGDCNGDGKTTAGELTKVITIINLCAGAASGCPAVPGSNKGCTAADRNGNGGISAGELTRIISNIIALPSGCPA